jgi:hypothetical protein
MSWLDAYFGIIHDRGTALELEGGISFGGGLKATRNSGAGRIDVAIDDAVMPGAGRVRAATTAALAANTRSGNTLTASANGALASVDGVALASGDELLVKNEAASANNGRYVVTSLGSAGTPWVLTRKTLTESSAGVRNSMGLLFVEEGTANGDKVFALTTDGTITLNATGLTFGAVASLTAGGFAAAANPADDGKFWYASAGLGVLTSTVKIVNAGASLSFGSDPAGSGQVRLSSGNSINAKLASGSSVALLANSTNALALGSSDAALVGATYTIGSGNHRFFIGATEHMTLASDSLRLSIGGAAVAGTGALRLPNATTIAWRNAANSANVVGFQVFTDNTLLIGDTVNAGIRINTASGGNHQLLINGTTELTVDANALYLHGNSIVCTQTNPADTGIFRAGNNALILAARNAAASGNLALVMTSGSNDLFLGSDSSGNSPVANTVYNVATAGSHSFRINNTVEFTFDATRLTVASGNDLLFAGATTSATSGKINVCHNVTIVSARNQANSTDVALLRYGVGTNDLLTLGSSSALGGLVYNVGPSATHQWQINDSIRVTLGVSGYTILNADSEPAAPAANNIGLYAWTAQLRVRNTTSSREDISYRDLGGTSNFTGANSQIVRRAGRTNTAAGAVNATLDQVTIPDNSVVTCFGTVRARNRTADEAAGYQFFATFKRRGGGVVQVGAEVVDVNENDAAWGIDVVTSANDIVVIAATTDAANILDWAVTWELQIDAI